jgi:uncharacterized protein YodC (DUF2158 family)
MATKQWKTGDKVRLVSGGPEMTVQKQWRLIGITEDTVTCQWFDGTETKTATFLPDSLVPA